MWRRAHELKFRKPGSRASLDVLGQVLSSASALATCSSILATLASTIPTKALSISTNSSTLVSRSSRLESRAPRPIPGNGQWQIAWPTVVWHAQFWAHVLPQLRCCGGSGAHCRVPASGGPSQADPPSPAMPSTATLNSIPCIFQAGQCASPWAVCPCAVSPSGRRCAPRPWLQGQTAGISPPTLPGCGFKAAGQCKLCFPGPARLLLLLLLLHSQECQQLLRASCAAG